MAHEIDPAEKNRFWAEQTEFCRRLDEAGVQEFFDSLDPKIKKELFHRANNRVGCIDEGCRGCGFRIAGSGILIKGKDRAAFMAKCLRLGVDGFSDHANCGAAGVYAQEHGGDPAALARDFSGKMAKELGVDAPHIKAGEMSRPESYHATRFVFYDGTARLNLNNGKLPNGFVLTRALYPTQEYAVSEAELAFNIASGSHGFGEIISSDEPVEIVVVGNADDPEMSLAKLIKELEPLSANPKIKITGFEVSPRELDR